MYGVFWSKCGCADTEYERRILEEHRDIKVTLPFHPPAVLLMLDIQQNSVISLLNIELSSKVSQETNKTKPVLRLSRQQSYGWHLNWLSHGTGTRRIYMRISSFLTWICKFVLLWKLDPRLKHFITRGGGTFMRESQHYHWSSATKNPGFCPDADSKYIWYLSMLYGLEKLLCMWLRCGYIQKPADLTALQYWRMN